MGIELWRKRGKLTESRYSLRQICEYAERKWASKVLKKEETTDLPTLHTYMEAVKTHRSGLSSHDTQPDVYEA
jgi:hypothetical protein